MQRLFFFKRGTGCSLSLLPWPSLDSSLSPARHSWCSFPAFFSSFFHGTHDLLMHQYLTCLSALGSLAVRSLVLSRGLSTARSRD